MLGQKVLDKLFLLWRRGSNGWAGWSGRTPWLWSSNEDNGTQSCKGQDVWLNRFSEDSVSGTHFCRLWRKRFGGRVFRPPPRLRTANPNWPGSMHSRPGHFLLFLQCIKHEHWRSLLVVKNAYENLHIFTRASLFCQLLIAHRLVLLSVIVPRWHSKTRIERYFQQMPILQIGGINSQYDQRLFVIFHDVDGIHTIHSPSAVTAPFSLRTRLKSNATVAPRTYGPSSPLCLFTCTVPILYPYI